MVGRLDDLPLVSTWFNSGIPKWLGRHSFCVFVWGCFLKGQTFELLCRTWKSPLIHVSSHHQYVEEQGKQNKMQRKGLHSCLMSWGTHPPCLLSCLMSWGTHLPCLPYIGPLGFVALSWTRIYAGPVPINIQVFLKDIWTCYYIYCQLGYFIQKSYLVWRNYSFLPYCKYMETCGYCCWSFKVFTVKLKIKICLVNFLLHEV